MSATFPGIPNDLQGLRLPFQIDLLVAYARHVRMGGISRRSANVRAQTVQIALRSISTTLQLGGKQNPLRDQEGKYPKAIQQLLEGYRRADPPPQPKLAVPVLVPNYMSQIGLLNNIPKEQAIGDLALIAFYYLLRVGEYTVHSTNAKRRTKQFRLCDITLWCNNNRLDPLLPLNYLLTHCTAATLNISNQKNGKRSQTIHHDDLPGPHSPVKAIIRRIKHIHLFSTSPHTLLGTYFNSSYPTGKSVSAADMHKAIQSAVKKLNLQKHGLLPCHVGTHSFRAGGATAMHLHGIDHNTIKKMGRWSSDTFMSYIHEQIAAFSSGISLTMSKPITFRNVAFQPTPGPILGAGAA